MTLAKLRLTDSLAYLVVSRDASASKKNWLTVLFPPPPSLHSQTLPLPLPAEVWGEGGNWTVNVRQHSLSHISNKQSLFTSFLSAFSTTSPHMIGCTAQVNSLLATVDCWLLTAECWLLTVDCWLLTVVDCCLLTLDWWLLNTVNCWLLTPFSCWLLTVDYC